MTDQQMPLGLAQAQGALLAAVIRSFPADVRQAALANLAQQVDPALISDEAMTLVAQRLEKLAALLRPLR